MHRDRSHRIVHLRLNNITEKATITPATAPMIAEPVTLIASAPVVIPTRPASAPLKAIDASGCLWETPCRSLPVPLTSPSPLA